MARYVVLYFENNDEAEAFATYSSVRDILSTIYAPEIVALVPAPTLFCECSIRGGTKGRGFFKGQKYGWWVCAKCGKPTEAWGTYYAAVVSAGNNLLEESNVQQPG